MKRLSKTVGRTFLSVQAGRTFLSVLLILLLLTPACSWFGKAAQAYETVRALIIRVNDQVIDWCDKGYLPPVACAEWMETYAQLSGSLEQIKEKWSGLKAKVINFIIRFLSGKFGLQLPEFYTGDKMKDSPVPDAGLIIEAAQSCHREGHINAAELESIEAAAH